jgi:PKD repeat protein
MKNNRLNIVLLIGVMGLLSVSCSKDEPIPVVQPVADFTYVVDGAAKEVTFTNTSTDADIYSWDFGDGSAVSTDASPVHTYATGGTYTVALTAAGESGSTPSVKSESVDIPVDKNYVAGGDFETADASAWTVITSGQEDGDGNSTNVKYAFGYTDYKPTLGTGGSLYMFPTNTDVANPSEEGTIFYQSLGNLDVGNYQISFLIKQAGEDSTANSTNMSNEWFEFVVNTIQPTVNDGYNYDRVTGWYYGGWTGWEVIVPAMDGPMIYHVVDENPFANLCDEDGIFPVTDAGTYYLAIKIGKGAGSTLGEGIAIDKLAISKVKE